ncbi:MAG: hypothetical protein QN122_13560 [Armatimonadota bacterium]|nr:hypothetical protein [Armatimonadota bacterium]
MPRKRSAPARDQLPVHPSSELRAALEELLDAIERYGRGSGHWDDILLAAARVGAAMATPPLPSETPSPEPTGAEEPVEATPKEAS